MWRRTSYCAVCLIALWAVGWFVLSASKKALQLETVADPDRRVDTQGRVVSQHGPVAGARVRFQGHPCFTLTDQQGRFLLPRPGDTRDTVTAAKEGFFIAGVAADNTLPLLIRLTELPSEDNVDYDWVDPSPNPEQMDNCGNCHAQIFNEWKTSGHARSATNRHFRNLYDGSDWHGRAHRGWGLLDEYPEAAGICAACHIPSLEPGDPAIDDLRRTTGVAAQGVHCDFCHKIQDTSLEMRGLAHGRYGLQLLRPTEDQILFGPLDDVDRGVETYSPLQKESRICASCHEGTVLGVHVYSTYSEWLASPARQAGHQCQTCHMTPTGTMTNFAPEAGGIRREPDTLASHTFLPGGREAMLRKCLQLTCSSYLSDNGLHLEVEVLAEHVGHRVPTGFIDRHVILVVQPYDSKGNLVASQAGPLLPEAVGTPWSGQPGQLFAKRLVDADGQSPVPFWRAGARPIDTRLIPGEPVVSQFEFPRSTQRIRVLLLYRRFWQQVAQSKSWPDNEIIVYDRKIVMESSEAAQ